MTASEAAAAIRVQWADKIPQSWDDHHASLLCPEFWLDAAKATRLVVLDCAGTCSLVEASDALQEVIPELFSRPTGRIATTSHLFRG